MIPKEKFTLKRLIVEGKIQTVTMLFENISVDATIMEMGRMGKRVALCLNNPGKWRMEEMHKLAEVLEMDPDILFIMMENELMIWKQKPQQKPGHKKNDSDLQR